jgi:lipoprotein-anchoring transpeptidase ErfK/SrfK
MSACRYVTPKGSFKVQSMRKMHRSSLFNNAPMPYSIFYSGHYAIHGTTEIRHLGSPASAGCVRLHPDNARFLFDLVQQRGPQTLQVVVDG